MSGRPTYDLATRPTDITELRPHPRNPRNGDTHAIAASLQVNGQYRPIVVARGGVILAGNHTYAAAMELGWEKVAAVHLDVDPDSPEAHRIMLADNRTADLGQYDEGLLLDLLRGLPELDGTGYLRADLDHLMELLDDPPPINVDGEPLDPTLLWPRIAARINPDLWPVWQALPGADDSDRIHLLLQARV